MHISECFLRTNRNIHLPSKWKINDDTNNNNNVYILQIYIPKALYDDVCECVWLTCICMHQTIYIRILYEMSHLPHFPMNITTEAFVRDLNLKVTSLSFVTFKTICIYAGERICTITIQTRPRATEFILNII